MKSNHIAIVILVVLSFVSFGMWIGTNASMSQFGLNAFTEILGILCTVVIVDALMAQRELQRALPQRHTAYEDVRLLVSRVIGFWSDIYRHSVPGACPGTVEALFTSTSFDKMMQCLDMATDAPMTPRRSWFTAVQQELQDQVKRANTILERHNKALDPVAYRGVHALVTAIYEPSLMTAIRQSDQEIGYTRPSVLGNYCLLSPNYTSAVLQLVHWCRAEKQALTKLRVDGLSAVSDTIGPWESCENPPSRISQDALEAR